MGRLLAVTVDVLADTAENVLAGVFLLIGVAYYAVLVLLPIVLIMWLLSHF